jgi:RND family efflux transporter MFP subunit
MAAWKQIVFCLVVLVAAAGAWVRFFPGASEILDRWGIDWAHASISKAETGKAATGSIARGDGNAAGTPQTTVVAARVASATINDKLQAIGTGRARATVAINPYTSGRLMAFLVQSGAHVEAGAVIARLDSETEQIALERARATRDDAKAKVDRMKALRSTNTASQVQLTDAELALRTAELSVHEAEVALDRRSVTSPISGVVGILPIEAGNYVTNQTSIATVDDRSSILVDFWVPERFAASVRIGDPIAATPLANPKNSYQGKVSAIDNRIDQKSRTLWVQATIDNPADSLRAGMAFNVTMTFPGDTYPSVSPLAVQWGTDGAFVWAVKDGKARKVAVRIIQRNSDSILVDAPIAEGDTVVTEGVQSIREGSAVRVAGSDASAPAAADGA